MMYHHKVTYLRIWNIKQDGSDRCNASVLETTTFTWLKSFLGRIPEFYLRGLIQTILMYFV